MNIPKRLQDIAMNNHETQFADLTKRREKWVDANRENGFEKGITNLLTELYPDNAHFIYELLQNAEDTQATSVCFTLTHEGIRLEHDGKRLFSMRDVDAITSIGNSTNLNGNDFTRIGKFGVGFKAVFAYTNTPEIHSGDFHFKIKNLVVPESLQTKECKKTTLFYFPFDNPKKRIEKAVNEIERGLRALADNTLLFLKHIREIEFHLPNGKSGKLKRVDVEGHGIGQRIEIHSVKTGQTELVSNWLCFNKDVPIADEEGIKKARQIAIAFRLEPQTNDLASGNDGEKKDKKKSAKSKTEWRIVSCEPGQVSIFFPAEKETSNLRFHLHAPFASTVARDSVRDCDGNGELRDALAQLTAEALVGICERGLLTISFLSVLPNEDDGLSDFYEPIRVAIVEAFQEENLLPTKSGSHLNADSLYRGPSDITSVIDDDDLSLLIDYETPLWALNAPQKGQREDKFLDSLQIDEWGWAELIDAIQQIERVKEKKEEVEIWLSEKQDNWLMRFYALMESCYLSETVSSYEQYRFSSALSNMFFVRTIDNKGNEEHVKPQDAFFPQNASNAGRGKQIDLPAKIPFVKPEVYEKGRLSESTKKTARDFLERVGVREYDERAEIERKLEWYSEIGEKDITENHFRDMRAFVGFLKRNPTDLPLFQGIKFLVTVDDAETNLFWTEPKNAFLDDPYETTGLGELTAIHVKQRLTAEYLDKLGKKISREELVLFLKSVGVMHDLKIERANAIENKKIQHRGKVNPRKQINIDWTIQSIKRYLANPIASRIIWMALLKADKEVAAAQYRPSLQYGIEEVESQLVQNLKSCAWIPDKHGVFRKPHDMTRDMLPKEFPYDDRNGLLTAIGFGQKAKEASEEFKARDAEAKKLGFGSVTDLEEAVELLKAKREGRIREVPKDELDTPENAKPVGQRSPQTAANAKGGNRSVSQPENADQSPAIGIGTSSLKVPQDEEANMPTVLRRISTRICKSGISSAPLETDVEPQQQPEDDDDYTPAPVDYSGRIARAEERNANEISRLEREQELLDKANELPRYSYGWFLALLELECIASSEKNAGGKTISISFGKVERDGASSRTILLKEPNRFIPQSVEELSGVRVDLNYDDGRTGKLHIESFTAKEFSLLGKLKSVDELNGIALDKVVEARIDVQNPSFLLQELLNRFRELGFCEQFDMKANLTPGIEFVFGPPGTGKTTHLAEKMLLPLMSGTEKAKVLVLTPTNKAADVLTTRIMDKMGADTSYRDWLIRFGTSADDRIEKEGVLRDRSFDISALDRSVTVSTIARFAYDGFAHGKLHEMQWDAIVIDEASMIPLVNIIYPLYHRKLRKFIIAGDPFQIEPIVSVEQWKDENIYKLVGLDKPGSFLHPGTEPHDYLVTNLETQYRSIPAIGEVFSRFTYNGILKHHRRPEFQRPLKMDGFNVKPLNLVKFPVSKYESIYRAKRLESGTPYQTYSALFTFEFVRWLVGQIQTHHAGEPLFRIGIIAPYRAQANLLSKLIDSQTTNPCGVEIQVGTIHGFQGDECDIIIAVFNPPPTISTSRQMFLNKQNILNVAISRARDYLFIVMPDGQTADVGNLRKIAKIEGLVRNGGAFSEYEAHAVEEIILGNALYLEENTFSTGHQMVNVYRKPERYYEVRSDDSAIDVQIHEKG